MGELGHSQEQFAISMAKLILFAYDNGYRIRPKHLLRCDNCNVGKKNSVHKLGLAIDIVLLKDGDILSYQKHFNLLHDYWDKLGGAPRIEHDLGHFSFAYRGVW